MGQKMIMNIQQIISLIHHYHTEEMLAAHLFHHPLPPRYCLYERVFLRLEVALNPEVVRDVQWDRTWCSFLWGTSHVCSRDRLLFRSRLSLLGTLIQWYEHDLGEGLGIERDIFHVNVLGWYPHLHCLSQSYSSPFLPGDHGLNWIAHRHWTERYMGLLARKSQINE